MRRIGLFSVAIFLLLFAPGYLFADGDDATAPAVGTGLFGLLNQNSKYFQDSFPEPLRVEDTTIDNELRFDWEHDEGRNSRNDQITGEIQKSLGAVTFEIQAPYLITKGSAPDDSEDTSQQADGFGNLEVAAHMPIQQFVSSSGFVDNSVGLNAEIGVPVDTRFSKNTEIDPGIFDDLALGDHFSLQTLFTLSSSVGPTRGSRESFEYSLAFAYAIEDEEFRVPHVERIIPIVELLGETALDGSSSGSNALTGTAGVRFELKSIFHLQPSFGVGYIFPIDKGGRDDIRWGVVTSLDFEF